MMVTPTKPMLEALASLAAEGGVLERRRGGVVSWNNAYWTASGQPAGPSWLAQQGTVSALIKHGFLRVTHVKRGAPSRCVITDAGREAAMRAAVIQEFLA